MASHHLREHVPIIELVAPESSPAHPGPAKWCSVAALSEDDLVAMRNPLLGDPDLPPAEVAKSEVWQRHTAIVLGRSPKDSIVACIWT